MNDAFILNLLEEENKPVSGPYIESCMKKAGLTTRARFRDEIKPLIDRGDVERVREGSKFLFKLKRKYTAKSNTPAPTVAPARETKQSQGFRPAQLRIAVALLDYLQRNGPRDLTLTGRKALPSGWTKEAMQVFLSLNADGFVSGDKDELYSNTREGNTWLANVRAGALFR